jgi:hypothetical protein
MSGEALQMQHHEGSCKRKCHVFAICVSSRRRRNCGHLNGGKLTGWSCASHSRGWQSVGTKTESMADT